MCSGDFCLLEQSVKETKGERGKRKKDHGTREKGREKVTAHLNMDANGG